MIVRFIKNPPAAKADTLACVRVDGTTTTGDMPRQGILPHDVIHFVVESTLGWQDAFFGAIARGATLDHMAAKLHGQNSSWSKMTQALQSESLVECLQAELWGGRADPATFAETLVVTCRRRAVPPPDITADEVEKVRLALREFGALWRPLPPGRSVDRKFSVV